jgi:hypothetical protein
MPWGPTVAEELRNDVRLTEMIAEFIRKNVEATQP